MPTLLLYAIRDNSRYVDLDAIDSVHLHHTAAVEDLLPAAAAAAAAGCGSKAGCFNSLFLFLSMYIFRYLGKSQTRKNLNNRGTLCGGTAGLFLGGEDER